MNRAGSRNLCVAGGVALNCKMTGRLHRSGVADRLFVQPLSYDAGVALGAAMLAATGAGDDPRFTQGARAVRTPSTSDDAIEEVLRRNGLAYQRCSLHRGGSRVASCARRGRRLVSGPDGSRSSALGGRRSSPIPGPQP